MAIYMKIDGVDGDVTADGHDKWIGLESFQFGCSRAITSAAGRGVNREASPPSLSEIVSSKVLDCASANLLKEALTGSGKKVEVHFVKTDNDTVQTYLTVELENALISNFSLSGHGGDGASKPSEMISLNFTKITFKTTMGDEKNKGGKNQVCTYDLATLKKA